MLTGIRPVVLRRLPAEVLAGSTLAALAIPEVLGYTRIAGTPVVTGLYTILVPMALFAVVGSSRHLVVGADSATAAMLAAGLVGLAATGSEEYVALAAVLALMSAALLLLARIARLGFMADFLSRTVLVGFLTGVGLQVALGEVGGALGLERLGHGAVERIWNDLRRVDQVNLHALGISVAVMALIVGTRRLSPRIPGALIAVGGSIAVAWMLNLGAHVPMLDGVPGGLPRFGLPDVDWSFALLWRLLPTALAMFVVILAQSAATSRAYALRHDEQLDENTDLVGLSVANLGAGLSGTFVVNGSPTKTEMVDSAGGRSQIAQLVTVLIVLVVLLFLTRPLEYLPECVLSTIVLLIGINLIDVRGMKRIHATRRVEFWIAVITASTVVVVGVEQGILLAIVLSLVAHTRHGYRPRNALLVPGDAGSWCSEPISSGAQADPGLVVYRFTHSIYYANARQLADEITSLVSTATPPLRTLCIDASAIDSIDYTAAETLRSLRRQLDAREIQLILAQVMDEVRRRDVPGALDGVAIVDRLQDVVTAHRSRGDTDAQAERTHRA